MEFFSLEFWSGLWDDFVQFLTELPMKILDGVLDALVCIGICHSCTGWVGR